LSAERYFGGETLIRLLLLLVAFLALPVPALAAWHEAKTRHFIIYADEDPDELRNYATKLERFDQAVRIARKMADPPLTDSGRLTIYILKNREELGRISGLGPRVFGTYIALTSGTYAFVARARPRGPGELNSDIVFYHEYAHHLMLQDSSAHYPFWLVEGFAELLSTAQIADDGSVTLGAAANHRSRGVYAPDSEFSTSAMVGDDYTSLDSWQWTMLYSRAWLLTHYLTFEPSRKGQLERYIEGIRSGQTPAESSKLAFGDLRQLSRDLDSYARRKLLSGTVVQTDNSKLEPIDIRPLSEAEAAILPIRMGSHAGVRPATAGRLAAKARKIARRFPDDPIVQSALARTEHDARNYSAAIAAADRAIAADPRNVEALIHRGRSLMRLSKENPAGADWEGIRSWFVRANHADPENPEPLLLFYQSFEEAGAIPTASAIKGLLYALVLRPQDDKLRMLAVRQLLIDGRIAEARQNFAPLVFDPHTRGFRDTAKEILRAIDARDAAKALSLIEEWSSKLDRD